MAPPQESQAARFTWRWAPVARATWRRGLLLPLVALLAAFISVTVLLRLATTVEIGADEGIELAKAHLSLKGFRLYSQVWSDQPPLYTFVLAAVMRTGAQSILAARVVTICCSCALLASVFLAAWKCGRPLVGMLATAALVLSPVFIPLSASVMLEIPALAPAVAGLAILIGAPASRPRAAASASGVLFGVALLTKLVPAVILPVAIFIIYARTLEPAKSQDCCTQPRLLATAAASIALLFTAVAITFFGLDLVLEQGGFLRHFGQTWHSHFGGLKTLEYGSPRDFPFGWSVLLKHWDTSVPALAGVAVCLGRVPRWPSGAVSAQQKSPRGGPSEKKLRGASMLAARWFTMDVVPVLWLALSLLVFGLHRPWWSYYYVHTAIPLCWCGAIGLAWAWQAVLETVEMQTAPEGWAHKKSRSRRVGGGKLCTRSRQGGTKGPSALPRMRGGRWAIGALSLFTVCAATWGVGRVFLEVQSVRNSPQIPGSLVLSEMARYKPFTKWLYTDDPIYSFHSGIPLPPDLAVVMLKRLWSGEMTKARLAAEVRQYCPGLILLRTGTDRAPFQDFLHSDYRLVYYDDAHRLYAHKSISNKPPL